MSDTSTRNRRAGSSRKRGPRHSGKPSGGRGNRSLTETLPLFVQHYMGECHQNATTAALAIGAKPASAHTQGYRLLKAARESGMLAEAARAVAHKVELQTEETLLELRNIALCDPRQFFDTGGRLVNSTEWTKEMAAAVSSIEVDEIYEGSGEDRELVGHTRKIKFWPKVEALNTAMKHLGLFERDNRQRADNLAIQINLVGAPTPEAAQEVEVRANLVKPNGHNGNGHAP